MRSSEHTDLQKLFTDQVRDIYWAEKELVKALPKMAKKANGAELRSAFENHLSETETHVERLESIFNLLDLKPRGKKCEAMVGLLEEADGIAEEFADSPALDAALIAAAQKVEHYEIASYGALRAFAKNLDLNDAVDLLNATIKEEGNADHMLTRIAESKSNIAAYA